MTAPPPNFKVEIYIPTDTKTNPMIFIPPNIEIWGGGSDADMGRIKSVYGTAVWVVSFETQTKRPQRPRFRKRYLSFAPG